MEPRAHQRAPNRDLGGGDAPVRSSAVSRALLRDLFPNARVIKLHYEHFRCDGRALFCNQSGCLHQEYVSTDGHYRLLRTFYTPGND
jgi:hypothetical protein